MRLRPRLRKTGSVTFTLTVDTSGFMAAMRKAAEAFAQLGRRGWVLQPASKRHAFMADFDLRCTAPGCGLLPEEH